MLDLDHLAGLANAYRDDLHHPVRPIQLRGVQLDFAAGPALMGVINLSPDSWYRESVCLNIDQAIRRGHTLHAQGAHLVDLGAESTLPHAERITSLGQQSKLLPVLTQLNAARIPVSIETYDPAVAQAALRAGAAVINFTGNQSAREIYRLVADHDAAVIICHVQGPNVREVDQLRLGHDPIPDFLDYFQGQIDLATQCGVRHILLDPGLGFYYRNLQDSASRVRFQMTAFLNTFRLRRLGFPICHALPHAFEFFGEEVRCAESFFAVLAALGQTSLFRTHEISRVKAVLDTLGTFRGT